MKRLLSFAAALAVLTLCLSGQAWAEAKPVALYANYTNFYEINAALDGIDWTTSNTTAQYTTDAIVLGSGGGIWWLSGANSTGKFTQQHFNATLQMQPRGATFSDGSEQWVVVDSNSTNRIAIGGADGNLTWSGGIFKAGKYRILFEPTGYWGKEKTSGGHGGIYETPEK